MATTNELLINITYDDAKAIANFKKVADKITTQASKLEDKKTEIATIGQAKREVDEQKHLDKLRRVREVYALKEEEADKRRAAAKLRNQNSWGTQMLSSVKSIESNLTANLGRATNVLSNFNYIIQDLPYGFRGIANNIPMLVQGFGQLSNATGGSTNALKLLLKSLAGPAGVLFAVSATVAILDAFFAKSKQITDLAKNVDTLKEQFGLTSREVQVLNARVKASGTSIDSFTKIFDKIKEAQAKAAEFSKEGSKSLREINKLGIGLLDDPLKAFEQLSIRIKEGKANALDLRNVFGENYKEIYNTLKNLKSEGEVASTTGISIFSEKELKSIKETNIALEAFGDAATIAFGKFFLGMINPNGGNSGEVFKSLSKTLNEFPFDKLGAIVNWLFKIGTSGVWAASKLMNLSGIFSGVGKFATSLDAYLNKAKTVEKLIKTFDSTAQEISKITRQINEGVFANAEGLATLQQELSNLNEVFNSTSTILVKETARYTELTNAVNGTGNAFKGAIVIFKNAEGVLGKLGAMATIVSVNMARFGRFLETIPLLGRVFAALGKYFWPITIAFAALDFVTVFEKGTTWGKTFLNVIYSLMHAIVDMADGFTFGILGMFESTKDAMNTLKKWIKDNAPKQEDVTNKTGDIYTAPKDIYTAPKDVADAILNKNVNKLKELTKKYKKWVQDAELLVDAGKLSNEDKTLAFNKTTLAILEKYSNFSQTPFESWAEGIKKGADEVGYLGDKIRYIQDLFNSASSEKIKTYYFNILEGLIKERDELENLAPLLTKHQEVLISFADNTIEEFKKFKEASESYVENLDYLWEQFYAARGKEARNFWREQINKLMAPVNDLPKNTNFEDAIRLAEEYAQAVVGLTSFELQRLDVEKAIKSTIAGTVVEYTNLEYNYKRSIELIDAEIEKNKDNIEVQKRLIELKKKTTEEYNAKKGGYFINMGTSFEDIFGATWEQQKETIINMMESAKSFSSALADLGNQTMQNAIDVIAKQIEAENELWNARSENLKAAGLENTAYYRMMEKEHNKNLKTMQDAENKANAEAWDKEQEYKKASMYSDLAMGIFRIWAESGINFIKGGILTALLGATFGVQMANLNSLKNPFRKYFGGWVGGSGASDNQAHLLSPGEFVVNSQAAKNNARALNDMNNGRNVSEPAINIHINGNVIGNRDYVRNHLAPEIKKAIREGYSFA